MKLLIPIVLVVVGLGAGTGAGLMLKPAPPPEEEHPAEGEAAACPEHSTEPCAAAPDPYKDKAEGAKKGEEQLTYVAFEKPFVIPIFKDEKVTAMVVISLSNAVGHEAESSVKAVEPLLRDAYLKVMFRHANSGGFDGSFTSGQKMRDLQSGLLKAAHDTLPEIPIGEVLVTDIARQDT